MWISFYVFQTKSLRFPDQSERNGLFMPLHLLLLSHLLPRELILNFITSSTHCVPYINIYKHLPWIFPYSQLRASNSLSHTLQKPSSNIVIRIHYVIFFNRIWYRCSDAKAYFIFTYSYFSNSFNIWGIIANVAYFIYLSFRFLSPFATFTIIYHRFSCEDGKKIDFVINSFIFV